MDRADVPRIARGVLEAVRTAWPQSLGHLMLHADDRPLPEEIHPVFHGCYDWHSSVHMHWSLLRLRKPLADDPLAHEIEAHFDARFTPGKVAREREYIAHPARAAFERPYGWAWILKLQQELDAQRARWAPALAPFASEIAQRLAAFLERSPYAVRAGMHGNTAFAMILARDYALQLGDHRLLGVVDDRARAWFGGDERYPAAYEPGGADFLSPGLCEALLMSRVLGDAFTEWWSAFDHGGNALRHWREPPQSADRTDPQLVHLAGLDLSRAWCLRALAPRLPGSQRAAALDAAQAHFDQAAPSIVDGDLVATHWLASFAMLCEEALSRSSRTPAS